MLNQIIPMFFVLFVIVAGVSCLVACVIGEIDKVLSASLARKLITVKLVMHVTQARNNGKFAKVAAFERAYYTNAWNKQIILV